MRDHPRLGKAGQEILRNVIYKSLGRRRSRVVVGPSFGFDNSVVRLSPSRVLVATTDPLSYLPTLGPRTSAWLSVHLLASDLSTSGFPPEYGLFDFNLPPTLTDEDFAKYWRSFHEECEKLGISIIGGHTGRYPGIDYTIIGGGALFAFGRDDRYLTSGMATANDDIILTKGVAVETTAMLARMFPKKIRRAIGTRLFRKAWDYVPRVTTVEDSLSAIAVGVHERGVTAMHDATEGGVIAGLIELASASKHGALINSEEIPVSEETREICKLFRIDPLISLSEGTLIIASKPNKTDTILKKLASRGISGWVVGKLSSSFQGGKESTAKGTRPLHYPSMDPYWRAYSNAVRRRWS